MIADGTTICLKLHVTDSVGFISRTIKNEMFLIANTPHQLTIPTLVFPSDGETLSGDINISWNPSVDSWGHSVAYNISYSTDGGTSWNTLATNLTISHFIWDSSSVSDGTNYTFKIEVLSSNDLKNSFISTSPSTVNNTVTTTSVTTTTTTPVITTTTTSIGTPGWNSLLLVLTFITVVLVKKRKSHQQYYP